MFDALLLTANVERRQARSSAGVCLMLERLVAQNRGVESLSELISELDDGSLGAVPNKVPAGPRA